MTSFRSINLRLALSFVACVPAAAFATDVAPVSPLDAVPVRVQVGNGLPLTTGGDNSLVGVSILSSQVSQGSAAGVRVLGSDKTAGVRVTKLVQDGGAKQVGFDLVTSSSTVTLVTKH